MNREATTNVVMESLGDHDLPGGRTSTSRVYTENQEFMCGMFPVLPHEARAVVCGFPGDPNNPPEYAWAVKPVGINDLGNLRALIDGSLNNYVAVSSFYPDDSGKYRRRKTQFAALHAVMIDDLGDGIGSKMDIGLLRVDPTVMIETSPNNYQAWLRLDPPISDGNVAWRLIKAMIKQGLMASIDPGMDGVTRVGRLPMGINGKPKYGGWQCRAVDVDYSIVFSAEQLIEAFGLDLGAVKGRAGPRSPVKIDPGDDPYLAVLNDLGMVTGEPEIYEGSVKFSIECPWIEEHTDRADTGTAYFIGGGFCCHHGHCQGRRFADVKQWMMQTHGLDVAALEREKVVAAAKAVRSTSKFLRGVT